MKKICLALAALLLELPAAPAAFAQTPAPTTPSVSVGAVTDTACYLPAFDKTGEAMQQWRDRKYALFIHFGLYSSLGGVWEGEKITRGYSEQIQSFAGIFSDWYAETARTFNPVRFNAREIVALARQAGMKSIVFTAKHHDGFCLFKTRTTDYNSVEATPCHRDFVQELSDACKEAGMHFALYFSLIDWHYPYAYPISSHNADFITPPHHELNKAQVRELLTHYGNITEFWFDMGSLRPAQSRELYQLVKSIQPDCMVSGRLGNDFYDFAVMADNAQPEVTLQTPWQSAASMFNETWGYRSWQERGLVSTKAAEKLRSLIHVVASGGNYLLNIGPDHFGGIVPFEREVLTDIGNWIGKHQEAIYGCNASPFHQAFTWGEVTQKGKELFLILSGSYPEGGKIVLPLGAARCLDCKTRDFAFSAQDWSYHPKEKAVSLAVKPELFHNGLDIPVVTLCLDREMAAEAFNEPMEGGTRLDRENAIAYYSYSCFDYYSHYKSTVAHRWKVRKAKIKAVEIFYTDEEKGSEVSLNVDGTEHRISLIPDEGMPLKQGNGLQILDRQYAQIPLGSFGSPTSWTAWMEKAGLQFQKTEAEAETIESTPFSNYIYQSTIVSRRATCALAEIVSGNGIEVWLNGQQVTKHLNNYREKARTETYLLPLKKGKNLIFCRVFNRFEKEVSFGLRMAASPKIYRTTLFVNDAKPADKPHGIHTLVLSRKGIQSPHTDAGLHNISLQVK